MGDGFDVGRTVAVLDEETLVVLEPIRRADDRVVQAIGVKVFDRLAHTLLEIGRRHHLQILLQAQRFVPHTAIGRFGNDTKSVDLTLETTGDGDFHLPALVILRNDPANGRITPGVTADFPEGRRDV